MTDRSQKQADGGDDAHNKASQRNVTEQVDDKTLLDTDDVNESATLDGVVARQQAEFSVDDPAETLLPGQWDSEGNSVVYNDNESNAGKSDGVDTSDGKPSLPPAGPQAATIDIPPEFTATANLGMSNKTGFESDDGQETLEDTLPERVGKYRVNRELGRGAFGVVYLAKDEDIDRDVAIKLSLVEDAHYQERLMVEASKVAKVAGEHIVPVLHVDRTEFGAVYIVQRFIDGCTLSTLMENDEAITPGQAMILIYQLALGLKTAHKQDILHRDLKPDNILLDSAGVPWIVDFGIAISEEEQHERRRELAGTPPYMSPEQIMGRVDFMDARSDIWALGVIFYEMLTGKLPFTGRSRKELTEQICKRDPKPVQQYSPETLTDEMNSVFRKCCAKEPIDRLATVDELADAMRGLIETYATVDDLEIPLGINVESGSGAQSSTRAGLERRATGNDSLSRSIAFGRTQASAATINDNPTNYLVKIASAAAIAAVVVIGFIVRDQMRPAVTPTVDSPEGSAATETELSNDPELVAYEPGSGPRLVAQSGVANYRTIQRAIDAASIDDTETIAIGPGFYHESLVASKSVRLVAAQKDQKPELLGNRNSVLTVTCDGGTVTTEGLSFSTAAYFTNAAGMDAPAKFNVINVKRGTLTMRNCQVSKASFSAADIYNGVHVSQGAFLSVDNCTFLPTPGFAVVGIEHGDIRIVDSRFNGDGIQFVGGKGVVRSCDLKGNKGIQVQQTDGKPIDISDCRFIANQDWSLSVTAGGNVRSSKNEFEGSNKAIWIGAQDAAMNLVGNAGVLTMEGDSITDCQYAVTVNGGALTMEADCSIRGGRAGVILGMGEISINELSIQDCEDLGVRAGDPTGRIALKNVDIENCGQSGISIEKCETLNLRNVRISQCSQFGLYFGEGNVSIDGLTVSDANMAVALMRQAQSQDVRSLFVKDCTWGMYVDPESGFEINMTISDSRFDTCSKTGIYAKADTTIGLKDVEFIGFTGRRKYLAAVPAKIVVVD